MQKLRWAFLGVFVALLFVCGLWLGKRWGTPSDEAAKIQDTATILRQVQNLSELVTVKYVLEKVVVLEDAKWYGDNRVTLVAHGVAKAGVDLKGIKTEHFSIRGDTVTVTLPKAILTDVYLDDRQTQVLERSTGVLRSFDKNLEQNARAQAVSALSKAARQLEIEKVALERAELQLRELLQSMGFKKVEFHPVKPEKPEEKPGYS